MLILHIEAYSGPTERREAQRRDAKSLFWALFFFFLGSNHAPGPYPSSRSRVAESVLQALRPDPVCSLLPLCLHRRRSRQSRLATQSSGLIDSRSLESS